MWSMLHYYRLGIKVSGNVQHVLGLQAENIREAKREWARIMGFRDGPWDERKQTYFGWPIVQTKQEPLQRKANPNPFQY